jgi:hypothetical protein
MKSDSYLMSRKGMSTQELALIDSCNVDLCSRALRANGRRDKPRFISCEQAKNICQQIMMQ